MRISTKKFNSIGLSKQVLDDKILNQFKHSLSELQKSVKKGVQEKTVEIPLQNFLRDTFYRNYHVNKKDNIDLAIFEGKEDDSMPIVLFEIKRPEGNKAEMMTAEKPNVKALHELVWYYLQEVDRGNSAIQHLIVTDLLNWYVFTEKAFTDFFRKDKAVDKLFKNCKAKKHTTDVFYVDLKSLLEKTEQSLECIYFNLSDFDMLSKKGDLDLLCRFFTPSHLLNLQSATNDTHQINPKFYFELLHILGLNETKNEEGNLVIKRLPATQRHFGSLIELAIERLETTDTFSELKDNDFYGSNREEQIESVALELCITWLNRILFLKLLEAQLIQHNYSLNSTNVEIPNTLFLRNDIIKDFDNLYDLFFKVLAKRPNDRLVHIQKKFGNIPYLNSSLFEIQKDSIERQLFSVDGLSDDIELPYFKNTVLLNEENKKRTGGNLTLHYFLEFLGSYNFGIKTDDKNISSKSDTMINASVLGKIFEKLNGYKDGAIFTPDFVTTFMTRQTLRHIVVQKLNDIEGVDLQTFEDAQNFCSHRFKKDDKQKFNSAINSIRICDPSVGSGHFLVSALNEMIAIKSDLGILIDSEGKPIACRVEVKNDELHIYRNNESNLFTYSLKDQVSQRIQETIFREKQTIIENCLFGVDINPKSVSICQLRLWIELLKNTFFTSESNFTELETLPNLDINIFSGDSLVGRFPLQVTGDIVKNPIEQFRICRHDYYKERSSEQKQLIRTELDDLKKRISKGLSDRGDVWDNDIQKIKTELFQKYKIKDKDDQAVQVTLDFGEVITLEHSEKEERSIERLQKKKERLEQERAEYDNLCRKAFEWRFQIPDVLNEKADFWGFDIIIGNPPYISQEELSPALKMFADKFYKAGSGMSDILVYFIELSFSLLRPSGVFSMIVSNKFMRVGYGRGLRQFLRQYRPVSIIDFGELPVFKEATAYPAIICFENTQPDKTYNEEGNLQSETLQSINFQCLTPRDLIFDGLSLFDYFHQNCITLNSDALDTEGWKLTSAKQQSLLDKIKNTGKPLSKYVTIRKEGKRIGEFIDVEQIFYGIKTGLNEAFVIDAVTKDKLIAKDPTAADIIKPFLAGRDVKRYKAPNAERYLIFTRRGIDINDYPSVKEYLFQNYDKLCPKPKDHKGDWKGRKEGNYQWFEIQDAVDYYKEFDKPKIMFAGISSEIAAFTYDIEGLYGNDNTHLIISEDKYLLGALNSSVSRFFLSQICDFIRGGFARLKISYVRQVPIPEADDSIKIQITDLVDKILGKKQLEQDCQEEEKAIDSLIYALYGLTKAEIAIIQQS